MALGALLLIAMGIGLSLFIFRDRAPGEAVPPALVADIPVAPAPRPTHAVTFSDGCLTAACHAGFASLPATHAPVVEDACDTCHLPDAGDHTFPLVAEAPNLCSSCHDTGSAKPVRHGALTEESCLACHDPHASEAPGLLAASSIRATCDQCHLIATGRSRHAPYDSGDCTLCHEPHASDNPRLLLGEEGIDHCAVCHAPVAEDIAAAPFAHRGLERGCLTCHAPHASDHAALLSAPAGEQCLACHQEIRDAIAHAIVPHDPVFTGDRCLACHDPHASGNPGMLHDSQTNVCLSCHDQPLATDDGRTIRAMADTIRNQPFKHGPVSSDQCTACHAVHGSQHELLLKALNPALLTGPFNIRDYALCFTCHDPNLVLEERTTVATSFRDADLNLHYVHVASKGSRHCSDCHTIHAGPTPHLIAQNVAFQGSDWIMPINFTPTETGGSCASGCHEVLSYSRTLPHDVPPPPPTGGQR